MNIMVSSSFATAASRSAEWLRDWAEKSTLILIENLTAA
jgi:hypothetical protein